MRGFWGADTAELRRIASAFDRGTEAVRGAEASIGGELDGQTWWFGHDADAFMTRWRLATAPRLRALDGVLADAVAHLGEQADAQDLASDEGDAPAPSAGASAPPEPASDDTEAGGPAAETPPLSAVPPGVVALLQDLAHRQHRVREDWLALTDEEREWLIENAPEAIGNLDGVPLEDRARANAEVAERLLDDPKLSDGDRATLEGIASGDIVAVVLREEPWSIVQMLGTPSDETSDVVVALPGTSMTFAEFATRGQLHLFDELWQAHPETLMFVEFHGEHWPGRIFDAAKEGLATRVGDDVAHFHENVIADDPRLDDARLHNASYSFGFSATTASEILGAEYDTVTSISGSNIHSRWAPSASTEYTNIQYDNDALNEYQGWLDLVYGPSADSTPAFEQVSLGTWSGDGDAHHVIAGPNSPALPALETAIFGVPTHHVPGGDATLEQPVRP